MQDNIHSWNLFSVSLALSNTVKWKSNYLALQHCDCALPTSPPFLGLETFVAFCYLTIN